MRKSLYEATMTTTFNRPLTPVPWTQVDIADRFWQPRRETNRTVTLPLIYEINRKNGVLDAYVWDWWDPAKGNPPWRIWVGDISKWIEASCYSLGTHPDAELEALVDHAVEHMLKGQKEDGYLYANPLPRAWRFANLQELHELYDIGHAMEAAVARLQATGKRDLLDAMRRYADLLDATFGHEEGKIPGYDGHPEVELALVKLYRATGEERYLKLAKFFVDERGREPLYFERELEKIERDGIFHMGWYRNWNYSYCQAHQPLREQQEAFGHAVRALYLYSGAVDVAVETGDAELLETCRRLWRSVTHRRMYVTGGVGSTPNGEAFTFDYDLPNENGYAETCANIALVFFAHRLLQVEADGEYADVMERALYNSVMSGIGLDGKSFFYANHHTVYPRPEGTSDHLATSRQSWFGCACCPPNIARLISSLGGYVYSTAPNGLFVHLYVGGSVNFMAGDMSVTLTQRTDYPWDEKVEITVDPEKRCEFTLRLRIPGWCRGARLRVNGKAVRLNELVDRGYASITREWMPGDKVELVLPMPVERIEANPHVRMDCGKVALQRGPVVYCLEGVDNGKELADLILSRNAELTAEYRPRLLGGTVVIRGRAQRRSAAGWDDQLYRAARSKTKEVDFLAVPYALWAYRKPGEMIVWIREK